MASVDVVMTSSGAASWAAGHLVKQRRLAEGRGLDGLFLLFADVRGEHPDNYRFLRDAATDVGGQLVIVRDGRTIWDVFRDRKFLGNTRIANCSLELKQRPARDWLEANCDPADTTVTVGIDWTEAHRLGGIRRAYAHTLGRPCDKFCRSLWDTEGRRLEGPGCRNLLPAERQWQVAAPLCEPPYLTREQMWSLMAQRGLQPPALYGMGFQHANCSGGCVKAGAGQFVQLLRTQPDVFADWERQEQQLRQYLDKPVAILRDRTGGQTRPLTLTQLRERERRKPVQLDLLDPDERRGCGGCFTEADD